MNEVDIANFTLQELKALAYDIIRTRAIAEQNLNVIQQAIEQRLREDDDSRSQTIIAADAASVRAE